jgi:hypothetical protein
MSLPSVFTTLLPVLAPVAAGYAVARWLGLSAKPLTVVLRYVLFPALLFTSLQDRMPFYVFLLVAATGAVMTLAGLALAGNAHRFLKPHVDRSAAVLNIACFAAPVLALGWATNGLGSACALFVGVALTWFMIESRHDPMALLREPWVYAVAAALVFQAGRISAPWLDSMVKPLSLASYPVLLLFLGASMHPWVSMRDSNAWATVGIRLLTGLGIALLAVAVLPFSGGVGQGLILASLAPPATRAMTLGAVAEDSARAQSAAALGAFVSLVAMATLLLTGWKPWA